MHISLQVYQLTNAFRLSGIVVSLEVNIFVRSTTSSSYPKVIRGSTGILSGPGHKISDALTSLGKFHLIEAPSPASPGFSQYVCQPGLRVNLNPTSISSPGFIELDSINISILESLTSTILFVRA